MGIYSKYYNFLFHFLHFFFFKILNIQKSYFSKSNEKECRRESNITKKNYNRLNVIAFNDDQLSYCDINFDNHIIYFIINKNRNI